MDCPGCLRCRATDGLIFRYGSGRPTKAHEYLLVLAKPHNNSYDMIAAQEPAVADPPSGSKGRRGNHPRGRSHFGTNAPWDGVGGRRNRRSVWSASVKPLKGATTRLSRRVWSSRARGRARARKGSVCVVGLRGGASCLLRASPSQ